MSTSLFTKARARVEATPAAVCDTRPVPMSKGPFSRKFRVVTNRKRIKERVKQAQKGRGGKNGRETETGRSIDEEIG